MRRLCPMVKPTCRVPWFSQLGPCFSGVFSLLVVQVANTVQKAARLQSFLLEWVKAAFIFSPSPEHASRAKISCAIWVGTEANHMGEVFVHSSTRDVICSSDLLCKVYGENAGCSHSACLLQHQSVMQLYQLWQYPQSTVGLYPHWLIRYCFLNVSDLVALLLASFRLLRLRWLPSALYTLSCLHGSTSWNLLLDA